MRSDTSTGDMQHQLCSAFGKNYPMTECALIVDGRLFLDYFDRPLVRFDAAEGKTIEAIFMRQTDMRHIDLCFRRGPKPSFEEEMREEPAGSE